MTFIIATQTTLVVAKHWGINHNRKRWTNGNYKSNPPNYRKTRKTIERGGVMDKELDCGCIYQDGRTDRQLAGCPKHWHAGGMLKLVRHPEPFIREQLAKEIEAKCGHPRPTELMLRGESSVCQKCQDAAAIVRGKE